MFGRACAATNAPDPEDVARSSEATTVPARADIFGSTATIFVDVGVLVEQEGQLKRVAVSIFDLDFGLCLQTAAYYSRMKRELRQAQGRRRGIHCRLYTQGDLELIVEQLKLEGNAPRQELPWCSLSISSLAFCRGSCSSLLLL